MEIQKCKSCGKELPKEAVFCPYCMTKLIESQVSPKGKSQKLKKKIILAVCITLSVLLIAVIGFTVCAFWLYNSDNSKQQGFGAKSEYGDYLGFWTDKYGDRDTVYTSGGPFLEMIETKDDLIKFNFSYISSAPSNTVAHISCSGCKLVDGVGNFEYKNDGMGNAGTGVIKLLEDEIHITTTLNDSPAFGWSIEGIFVLVKDETGPIYVDPSWVGEKYEYVCDELGTETAEVVYMGDVQLHTYGALAVTVDEKGVINTLQVDYSFALSGIDYCYDLNSFNGNSSYYEVIRSIGEPDVDKIKEKFISYQLDINKKLDIRFDDDLQVTFFTIIEESQ